MSRHHVSESELFRATKGLAIGASLKRTLAYCLFWMQHATHRANGIPTIWKTGPELEEELSIAARTANRHLKELAQLGYWSLTYRPRPGTIGKVTWLTLGPEGAALLTLARNLGMSRRATTERSIMGASSVSEEVHQTSQTTTSTQTHGKAKTTGKLASFLLSGNAKKEALQKTAKGLPGIDPIPPKFLKVSAQAQAFAKMANDSLARLRLTKWDWSSRYTWAHVVEIISKLQSRDIHADEWEAFVICVLENWSWMRTGISHRYAWHDANLHAPSPMAFAHEFERIYSMFEEHTKPRKKTPTFTTMDEGF